MKFSNAESVFLAREWGRGVPQKTLAERYGVGASTICEAIGRALARHFPDLLARGHGRLSVFSEVRQQYADRIPSHGTEPQINRPAGTFTH